MISASPLYSLIDEDGEPLPNDEDIQPRKRRSVDAGDGVALATGVTEGDLLLRETMMIFVGDNVEQSLEALRPVVVDAYVSLHSEGMETEGATANVLDPSW